MPHIEFYSFPQLQAITHRIVDRITLHFAFRHELQLLWPEPVFKIHLSIMGRLVLAPLFPGFLVTCLNLRTLFTHLAIPSDWDPPELIFFWGGVDSSVRFPLSCVGYYELR
jgi:hypothetical protein